MADNCIAQYFNLLPEFLSQSLNAMDFLIYRNTILSYDKSEVFSAALNPKNINRLELFLNMLLGIIS